MFSPRDVWRGRSLQALAGVPEWRNLAEPESLFSFCRQTSKFENGLRSLVSNIVNDSKNMWVCKRYVWWHCSLSQWMQHTGVNSLTSGWTAQFSIIWQHSVLLTASLEKRCHFWPTMSKVGLSDHRRRSIWGPRLNFLNIHVSTWGQRAFQICCNWRIDLLANHGRCHVHCCHMVWLEKKWERRISVWRRSRVVSKHWCLRSTDLNGQPGRLLKLCRLTLDSSFHLNHLLFHIRSSEFVSCRISINPLRIAAPASHCKFHLRILLALWQRLPQVPSKAKSVLKGLSFCLVWNSFGRQRNDFFLGSYDERWRSLNCDWGSSFHCGLHTFSFQKKQDRVPPYRGQGVPPILPTSHQIVLQPLQRESVVPIRTHKSLVLEDRQQGPG